MDQNNCLLKGSYYTIYLNYFLKFFFSTVHLILPSGIIYLFTFELHLCSPPSQFLCWYNSWSQLSNKVFNNCTYFHLPYIINSL